MQGEPSFAGALVDIESGEGDEVCGSREAPASGGGLESRASLVVSRSLDLGRLRETDPYFCPPRLGSAPISTSFLISSTSPLKEAAVSGVPNRGSCALASAPLSSSLSAKA